MSKSEYSIGEVFDNFCKMESSNNLFSLKINNVYVWKLLRFSVFMEICKHLDLYGDAHPDLHDRATNKYIRLIKKIITGTLYNPLRDKTKYDILIFPHPRKININGVMTDIYTYLYETEFLSQGVKLGIVERPNSLERNSKANKNIYYNESISLKTLKYMFQNIKTDCLELNNLLNEIGSICGVDIKKIKSLSTTSINTLINRFLRMYDYYLSVLKYHKPKQVYLVVSYGHEALIAACRTMGIETVEIQHGTITAYHVGYSYPKEVEIPYMPDKLDLWGKYWFETSGLPIKEKQVRYTGFKHLNNQIQKLSAIQRESRRVLFISQGTIAKKLIHNAVMFAKDYSEYNIVYRLHPSEVKVWRDIYPELDKAVKNLNNLVVETHNDNELYSSFMSSSYVVGVYSTALLEGIAANCFLILVNLPGVEYFQDLIDRAIVPLANDHNEISDIIKNSNNTGYKTSYFFNTEDIL